MSIESKQKGTLASMAYDIGNEKYIHVFSNMNINQHFCGACLFVCLFEVLMFWILP